MRIPYLKRRSQFYKPVLDRLPNGHQIAENEIVICEMPKSAPSGLEGAVVADIVDGLEFDSDWEGKDRTWFGARIKAAATALRDARQRGRFLICHKTGENALTIRRIHVPERDSSGQQLVTQSQSDSILEAEIEVSRSLSQAERNKRLGQASKVPERIQVLTVGFRRNADVIVSVLHRANGVCENCLNLAPFRRRSDGSPYLEVHHLIALSEGGEDTVENAVALCPNCHRKAHHG